MSKAEKLLEAIGELSEGMIAEAAEPKKLRSGRKRGKRKGFVLGSGLAAAAAVALVLWQGWPFGDGENGEAGKLSDHIVADGDRDHEQIVQESAEDGLPIYLDAAWLAGSVEDTASSAGVGEKDADVSSGRADSAAGTEKHEDAGDDGQVELHIDETLQILPQEDSSEGIQKKTTGGSGLQERYFALQIGQPDTDAVYHVAAEYGVSCSTVTEEGREGDFSETVTCEPGDTVWFLVTNTAADAQAPPEGADWEEQGITPVAKAWIQTESEEIDKTIYIGAKEENYYLLLRDA